MIRKSADYFAKAQKLNLKDNLGTQNARLGKIVIKTYTNESELFSKLPSVLDREFKPLQDA